MTKAAWIGLGVMGRPMAGYLSQQENIELTVYNRTLAKAEAWCKDYKGTPATTPAEAASNAEFVFSCIGNDDDLREITIGENGTFKTMAKGGVLIDHSTTSATVAREIAEKAREAGLFFLDAPITGGQKGAEAGTLSIMVGGAAEALARAHPLIMSYAAAIQHMGPSGSGQLTKMVNQIAIAGLVEALAEAINFAKTAGLDVEKVLNVTTKGAARSWQMENSGLTMAKGEFNFGFAVDWMRKDLGITLAEAAKNGAPLPVTEAVKGYFDEVSNKGHGRLDITSLIKRFDE